MGNSICSINNVAPSKINGHQISEVFEITNLRWSTNASPPTFLFSATPFRRYD